MPRWLSSLLAWLASAVWTTLFVGLGYLLGDRWERVGEYSDLLNSVVVGAVVVVIGAVAARRLRRRRHGLDPVTGQPRQ